jgi:cell division transport system ATP-binding protein
MPRRATPIVIEMYHVSKAYERDAVAIHDVSTRIDKAEFVFLTGASGAGKTTFLKLIFRELRPSEGQILVAGRNIGRLSWAEIPALRREIGVVFQDFRLLPERSVLENVELPLSIRGMSRDERRERSIRVLKHVGLQHKLGSHPPKLSGGEQQRVSIARALVAEPYILLADEPTGNLDPDMSFQVMELLLSVNAHGTTVVVATHDAAMIQRLGQRRIVLDRGRIVEGGA